MVQKTNLAIYIKRQNIVQCEGVCRQQEQETELQFRKTGQ